MRWQQLFADLTAQFEEQDTAAERAGAASRARAEMGAVHLADRLRGALGRSVALRCRGAGDVSGVLVDVGPDWMLLDAGQGREVLVAARTVLAVAGLDRRTAVPVDESGVRARLDLRWALRGLARDRSSVTIVLEDGAQLAGTVDRVGADYVELAEHPIDRPRRAGEVRGVRAVLLGAVAIVTTAASGVE